MERRSAKTVAAERARLIAERLRWSREPLTPAPPSIDLLPLGGVDDEAAAEFLHADDPLGSGTPLLPGVAIDPDAVVLGALLMAASIATQTADDASAQRMATAVRTTHEQMTAVLDAVEISPERTLRLLVADWNISQCTTLLIELALSNPFAPYEHDWPEHHRHRALAYVAHVVGLHAANAAHVIATFEDATRAHRNISVWRAGAYGVAGAAIVGGAGFIAAPLIGAALGSAVGLSGAAATSHGLALIGGLGSTHTMAAGTWLLAQSGALAGAVGAVSGSTLFQLGAAQAQTELVKLQVAAKVILVDLQHNSAAAHQVAERLNERVSELEARLDIELGLNDPDSDRIKTIRLNVQALADARDFVEDHTEDDDGGIHLDVAIPEPDIASFSAALHAGDAWKLLDQDDQADIEAQLQARFRLKADLDRHDVLAAIAAGVVGGIVDSLLVATPASSPLTSALRDMATTSDNWLSKHSPVPFDQSSGDGFTPKNHRVLTAGHDPLIGLIWGTLDIINGTMTRSTVDGGLMIVDNANWASVTSLVEALSDEIVHLLSDICTPAGLPLPGWTAVVSAERTAETAVKMYTRGYDSWHAIPMSVPVAAVDLLVALWAARRSYPAGEPKLDAIRLIAHGVAASADLVQLVITSGNPLVINYVQWLTLARRIASAASAQASVNVTDTLVADLDANQLILNRGWNALLD